MLNCCIFAGPTYLNSLVKISSIAENNWKCIWQSGNDIYLCAPLAKKGDQEVLKKGVEKRVKEGLQNNI